LGWIGWGSDGLCKHITNGWRAARRTDAGGGRCGVLTRRFIQIFLCFKSILVLTLNILKI
jgi:hypothetical protein